MRARAEEAITCIQYIQSFAMCSDLAELPELFQDGSRLPEAAVLSCSLQVDMCWPSHVFSAGYVRAAPLIGSRGQQFKGKSFVSEQAQLSYCEEGVVHMHNHLTVGHLTAAMVPI